MEISINYAKIDDLEYLLNHDRHVTKEMLENKINREEIIIVRVDGKLSGLLRYNYFWDNIPFMNLLYIDENFRKKGLGSKLVCYWEKAMKEKRYKMVMTSTMSNEQAQFFYRKQGYKDTGCLLLENEPLEILFTKNI